MVGGQGQEWMREVEVDSSWGRWMVEMDMDEIVVWFFFSSGRRHTEFALFSGGRKCVKKKKKLPTTSQRAKQDREKEGSERKGKGN